MIYFIQAEGSTGPVKIGFIHDDSDLEKRLSGVQVGNPTALHVAAVADGDRDTERALHNLFADEHIRGEWFTDSPRLHSFVFDVCQAEALHAVQGRSGCPCGFCKLFPAGGKNVQ